MYKTEYTIMVRLSKLLIHVIVRSRLVVVWIAVCHFATGLVRWATRFLSGNDALYKGDWELAYRILEQTNDFPEFTGRVCPALCEKSCVLNLSCGEPTTNREDECAIAERAFIESYIHISEPKRNGHQVAVIGSGPAGLATANRLNKMGYLVTVFEQEELPGGLLRYGILISNLIRQ